MVIDPALEVMLRVSRGLLNPPLVLMDAEILDCCCGRAIGPGGHVVASGPCSVVEVDQAIHVVLIVMSAEGYVATERT